MKRVELVINESKFWYDPDDHSSIIKESGKFNSVYRGYDENNNRPVVIKKLNESLNSNHSAIERFKREFDFNVAGPNLVQTTGYLFHKGSHYIIREYFEGIDLKKLSQYKRINTSTVVIYITQILDALESLHHNGIVHCDIRPANIIAETETQNVKLIDIGLAKKINDTKERRPFALIYSPPEQLLNRSELLDQTSDLYALGITMYELLTAEYPYYDSNPEFLMNLQLTQKVNPHKKIPQALLHVIEKATYKHPFTRPPQFFDYEEMNFLLASAQKKRYQTAKQMKDALLKIQTALKDEKSFWSKLFGN